MKVPPDGGAGMQGGLWSSFDAELVLKRIEKAFSVEESCRFAVLQFI